jgi:hypothetical protein
MVYTYFAYRLPPISVLLIKDKKYPLILKELQNGRLAELLEEKKFRVANSGLTYRQVHGLSKDKLLDEKGRGEGAWRKFSWMEIIYLYVVKEVRGFGLRNDQLLGLRRAFLRDTKPSIPEIGEESGYGISSVALVFAKVQMILTISIDGDVIICDGLSYGGLHGSFIRIGLNEVVNSLIKKMGVDKTLNYKTMLEVESEIAVAAAGLTKKEKELIDMIRNEDYKTVEVKKNEDDTWIANGEKGFDGKGRTALDVLRAVRQKDFQEIKINTRNGKVAYFTVKDIQKLS